MTASLNAVLTLLPNETEGHHPPSEPVSDGGQCLPAPLDMAKWRQEADVRAEALLTEFDADILCGRDAAASAHRLIHEFMRWTCKSIQCFNSTTIGRVDKAAHDSERIVWAGLADLAAQAADVEPGGVDRFLRIWLAVVHEATATGQAWLYAR
jgi:hypothetical protein